MLVTFFSNKKKVVLRSCVVLCVMLMPQKSPIWSVACGPACGTGTGTAAWDCEKDGHVSLALFTFNGAIFLWSWNMIFMCLAKKHCCVPLCAVRCALCAVRCTRSDGRAGRGIAPFISNDSKYWCGVETISAVGPLLSDASCRGYQHVHVDSTSVL